jgi:hypothetical protein
VQPLLQWKSHEFYTIWVCVFVALGIQHAMRIRHTVICDLPRATIFFHIISLTVRFSKNVTGHKMCAFVIYTTFAWNLSHSKNKWSRYDKNAYWSSCKVSVNLVRLERNFNFLDRCSKNPQISNFIKIRPVGAELFHADERTDDQTDGQTDRHDETNSRFSKFCEYA